MTYPLAVSVNVIGERSETFLRRHVIDLVPGRTISVGSLVNAERRDWEPPPPILDPHGFDSLTEVVNRMRSAGVCVLLTEYLDESLPWIEATRGSGIQLFAHAHGYDVSERLRDTVCRDAYLSYRDTGGIITMSAYSRATLIELGLPATKVHCIPYGVDVPDLFTPRTLSPTLRLLAVGRMVSKKAPLLLLDAFRRAALLVSGLRLDYVGDGPLLGAAQQYVAVHQLAHSVALHGGLPNARVGELMNTVDVFVQHSMTDVETGNQEGLPVAILEAMAAGLPVVSTRHAGIPEAVDDTRTGFLVNEGDTVAMAEAIIALAQRPALRTSMGMAGWERARQQFTWTRERAELLTVLGLRDFL